MTDFSQRIFRPPSGKDIRLTSMITGKCMMKTPDASPKNNLSFAIKPYKKGDEVHIIALFEKVFGKTMGKTESARHWQWEIAGNPVKPISIMLAWDGDRLISHEGANLLRVWVNGVEHLGVLIFDTMTDPEYKGQGIFSETAKSLYKDLTEKGYQFIYGFPNANVVQARIRKLDWVIIAPMPIHICPLDVGPFIRHKTRNALLGSLAGGLYKPFVKFAHHCLSKQDQKNIEIRRMEKFDQWADDLWLKCRNQHKLWVVRDFEYLSWRYDQRPESQFRLFTAWHHNEIAGYIITASQDRDQGKVSFILDILAVTDVKGVVEKLLNAVITASMESNEALISAMAMPASVYRKAFHKFFFIPVPEKMFPQEIHFGARLLGDKISRETFYNPQSWYISWGDTDLF
ncbi:MAG: GNAT family N-acetyltransferase [Deltaproteobacteria bacterium]